MCAPETGERGQEHAEQEAWLKWPGKAVGTWGEKPREALLDSFPSDGLPGAV